MNEPQRRGMSGSSLNYSFVERRRHRRTPLSRSCKVLSPVTHRYLAGATCDVSAGGVLLEIKDPRRLAAGDRVEVCIDWQNQGIVSSASTICGKVAHVELTTASSRADASNAEDFQQGSGTDATVQLVGIAFDLPITLQSVA